VKVHDYRGKAIYKYNLLTGEWFKEAGVNTPDIDERIREYDRVGHQIDHPGTISLNKADEWIAHALKEAKRLGLTVEQPQA
jgi:hypothetical protein